MVAALAVYRWGVKDRFPGKTPPSKMRGCGKCATRPVLLHRTCRELMPPGMGYLTIWRFSPVQKSLDTIGPRLATPGDPHTPPV